MAVGPVRIEGLRELQQALRTLDAAYPRELRTVNKDAADIVAESARRHAQALGGVAAKTAPSIKAAAEQRRAKVSIGGPAFPFAMGAEFGGRGRPTTQQFRPWRGNDSGAGYFLYPAIRGERDAVENHYERALDELARKHFDN